MARMLARVVLLFCALLPSVASGQYYDWGRSPQGMRWMQAKLPSGKVVFPDYYSDNAARVARYLDTIRPSISYGFEYAPLKMPVVLHTENFVANGMAMWAPKRIELEMIPDAQPFAEPWLKHLVTHEYRHAVQYGNLYRRFMKGLGYVLGQQAGFVSSVLVPVWFLEGDAVMAETQMSSFGRALQPSFTVEYRAYLTEGKQRFPLDKWFCGSYRNYIPDHYQFGYQLVAWSRERYGDDMWSRVADYGARRPYTILTTKWALRKYYRTSVNRIARSTLDDLTRFWRSQPVEPNSASILPTPLTSYTVYRSPMRLDGSTLLALKKDMDRPNRLVAVDLATGRERRIAWTGSVNTPPVLGDSVIYWSEYRSSTLWEQRVFSVACRYDLRTGRRKTLRKRGNALYPTPLPGGRLVTVGYDYTGQYLLDRGDGRRFPFPRTMSVHGLAYDSLTRTLAFIGLDDEGMSIGAIDPESGAIRTLLKPSYVSIYNLRAGAGLLSFNSIQSGKDEIHLYDLRAGRQYRLSRSRYGSLSPSAPEADSLYYFTTYTLDGYRLSTQRATAGSLVEVEYSELPVDRVNPPRRKWDVMNIDTVDVSFEFAEGTPVKRFRKGTHLFNVHSWAPWDFDPVKVTSENPLQRRSRRDRHVAGPVEQYDRLLGLRIRGRRYEPAPGCAELLRSGAEVRARFQLRRRAAVAVRLPQRGAGAETEKVFRPEPEGLPADDSVVGLSHADADSLCRAPPHQRADLGERSLWRRAISASWPGCCSPTTCGWPRATFCPAGAMRCAFRRCRLLSGAVSGASSRCTAAFTCPD